MIVRFRANGKVKCSRCGADLGDGQLGVEHGHDTYCVDCAAKKGFVDKKDVENAKGYLCSECGESLEGTPGFGSVCTACLKKRENDKSYDDLNQNYCPKCKMIVKGSTTVWREHLKDRHPELVVPDSTRDNAKYKCPMCGGNMKQNDDGDGYECEKCGEDGTPVIARKNASDNQPVWGKGKDEFNIYHRGCLPEGQRGRAVAQEDSDADVCEKCGKSFGKVKTKSVYDKDYQNSLPDLAKSNMATFLETRRKNVRPTVEPKAYSFKFIEPGLVKYEDVRNTGHVLVRKETLDKMLPTFVGMPIINMMHKHTRPETFREEADGIITRAYYNSEDGWYWADGLVWDPDTQNTCDIGVNSKGFSVSCAYDPLDGTEVGGDWHNIPYEGEITNGKYTHMAIVPNPRYEDAEIHRLNSKGGSMLKMFAWLKGEKKEIDPESTILVNGKPMKISDAVTKIEEAERTNAVLPDETEIEVGGKKTTVGEFKKRLNAKDDEDESDEDKEKKKKDAEEKERTNAKFLANKEAKEAEERLNAKHFDELEAARKVQLGSGVETTIRTKEESIEEGRKMFGSQKK